MLFCCTGVGLFNRGIESFFRDAFDGLKDSPGLDAILLKGGGAASEQERVAWTLPRTGKIAPALGKLSGRNGYVVEQWSSLASVVGTIRDFRPQVVFYSESNLGFLLHRFERRIGVPFRLLFSNGGPCHPPFDRTDFVQQVAPPYYDEAIAAGESASRHFMVPYGINVPHAPPRVDDDEKREIRRRLGLPLDRKVILSVGWIASQHKRMDYTIREVASLREPRPYLQLLGAIDEASNEIFALARQLLGDDGFGIASVPYEQVPDFYRAADCFVLSSLQEGFGRVYLEALMHGLPTVAHHHPVMQHVLGDSGVLADLSAPGNLAHLLPGVLAASADQSAADERWRDVQRRFSWDSLRSDYLAMFAQVAESVA